MKIIFTDDQLKNDLKRKYKVTYYIQTDNITKWKVQEYQLY